MPGRATLQATRRPEKAKALLAAAVWLVLCAGIVLGLLIMLSPRHHLPSEKELERLCAPAPGVELRRWEYVILHHSAGETGDAASIDKYHRRGRGWQHGLGYDFVIGNGSRSGDGEIQAGRRWKRQLDGAHCKAGGMNRKAIGVCFVGDFHSHADPSEAQLQSGVALVRYLARKFAVPPDKVLGHGEVSGASTKCPGQFFPMARIRAAARPSRQGAHRTVPALSR